MPDEISSAPEPITEPGGLNQILGESPTIQAVRAQIEKIAACDVNVLITGESGTGKELAAWAIHRLGRRSPHPFVAVNCGAIPENLFENELFGHVRGAFTDARSTQKGLVREAEKGTLFLDEISAISPFIQVKLLRLIQEKEFKPLGDGRPIHADIKIIAATNKTLEKLVSKGQFREDLYYRLTIVELKIPALRDRPEDIPLLANHFIKKYCREFNLPMIRFTARAMASLIRHDWPGNIRELENVIQQLIVMADSALVSREKLESHFDHPPFFKKELDSLKKTKKRLVEKFEKDYLKRLLRENRGNVAVAALKAGKSRTAFWNLLKKYALDPRDFTSASLESQINEIKETSDSFNIKEILPKP